MTQNNQFQSIQSFITKLTGDMKANAPVRTGSLRDSIKGSATTTAGMLGMNVVANSYAQYVNAKDHFIDSAVDGDIEAFADQFVGSVWEDFYNDNK